MASIYHYLPPEGASGSVETKKFKGCSKKKKIEKESNFFDHVEIPKNSF